MGGKKKKKKAEDADNVVLISPDNSMIAGEAEEAESSEEDDSPLEEGFSDDICGAGAIGRLIRKVCREKSMSLKDVVANYRVAEKTMKTYRNSIITYTQFLLAKCKRDFPQKTPEKYVEALFKLIDDQVGLSMPLSR
jgi:hypothetical protein